MAENFADIWAILEAASFAARAHRKQLRKDRQTRIDGWVGTLSEEMRLPESDREAAYGSMLITADPAVKVAKLAEIVDNLIDSHQLSPEGRTRTIAGIRTYLAAIATDLPEVARRPLELVRQLLD